MSLLPLLLLLPAKPVIAKATVRDQKGRKDGSQVLDGRLSHCGDRGSPTRATNSGSSVALGRATAQGSVQTASENAGTKCRNERSWENKEEKRKAKYAKTNDEEVKRNKRQWTIRITMKRAQARGSWKEVTEGRTVSCWILLVNRV